MLDHENLKYKYNEKIFGLIVAYIVALSIVSGLYLSGANKAIIISAIVAFMFSDPLSHLYAFYISKKMENLDWNAFALQIIIHLSIIIFFIVSKTLKSALLLSYLSFIVSCLFVLGYYKFSVKQTAVVICGLLTVVMFTIFMERGSNHLLKLFKYL
jgi:hypothetical protein|tara:strand:- start:4308 stop:4775 length:468 start_codon:yes stop_codon:yes gene_type:complete